MCQILILGSERSGTNLLRALLSSHSKIASPPPAGFVDALGGIQDSYQKNNNSFNLSELIDDVIKLTTTHHNPWDITLNSKEITERLQSSTLWDVFRVVNEIYAEQHKKTNWCSKEPGLFKYINDLSENIQSAKFVYLVRDGRDVAASMLKGHLHEFHTYAAAQTWSWSQKQCLNALKDPQLADKIYLVKYEDLIGNPEEIMRNLMNFLGIEFEKTQLQYYKSNDIVEHSKKSRFWKNLNKPIDKTNKGNYKVSLGKVNIEIFESVAWDEMKALNYQVDSDRRKIITDTDIDSYNTIALWRKRFWSLDPRAEAFRNRARTKVTQEIINRQIANKI